MRKVSFFLLFFLIFSSGCVEQKLTFFTKYGEVKINIEIADTDKERQKGLMFRDKLDENSGMVFIFEEEKYVSFWMKNTKIPLDMIFVSSNGTITEIKDNIQPCVSDPCDIYTSKYPTKYVIEVNAGFSRKNNIDVNDRIKFNYKII